MSSCSDASRFDRFAGGTALLHLDGGQQLGLLAARGAAGMLSSCTAPETMLEHMETVYLISEKNKKECFFARPLGIFDDSCGVLLLPHMGRCLDWTGPR